MKGRTVLFISHSSGLHGAEQSLGDIIVRCIAQGNQAVVTVPQQGPAVPFYQGLGARVLKTRTRAWTGRRQRGAFGLVRLFQCLLDVRRHVRVIIETAPDAVVTNTSVTPSGAVAAYLTKTPHVWIVREAMQGTADQRSVLSARIRRWLVEHLSVAVGVISEFVEHEGGFSTTKTFRVHPNPASRDADIATVPAVVTDYELPVRLLLLGRISPEKGQAVAIEAVARLRAPSNFQLRIVGTSRDRDARRLRRLIARSRMSGVVEVRQWTSRVLPEYDWAHFLLMASENEPYGRVTSQALQLGIPIIARPLGATPEVLGGHGLLCRDGSLPALTEILQTASNLSSREYLDLVAKAAARGHELSRALPQFDSIALAVGPFLRAPHAVEC